MNNFVDRLPYLAILVPILLLSMTAHELAHGWIAYRLGDPTAKRSGRLSLNPLKHLDPIGSTMFFVTLLIGTFVFGWAKPVPVSPYYFKNRQRGFALVSVAGPVTNFIIALLFLVVLKYASPAYGGWMARILSLAFLTNLALGLFNLIPIPPLDGSRILGAFLPRNAYEKWAALDQYGMFLVLGMLLLFRGPFARLVWWVVDALSGAFGVHLSTIF